MTNEEAINFGKIWLDMNEDAKDSDTYRFIELAIKALEQQPSVDYISRQATKEMLMEEWTKYVPMDLDINLSFVLEKLSELPSVTPQQTRWIPVSERLPEETKRYLVYTRYDEVMTDFFCDDEFLQGEDIVAWMPLPQPYRESEER